MEPLSSYLKPDMIKLGIARSIKNILYVFMHFEKNRPNIIDKIKKMQSTSLSVSGITDKSTFDYSTAMNLLVFKLDSDSERLKAKKAIHSAYDQVASICVHLEQQTLLENFSPAPKG